MTIVQKAENYIFQLFKDKLSSDYIYHNFNHTLRVVNSVKVLIDGEKINAEDAELLLIAAWFHDSGYIHGHKDHEDESIKIATAFLKDNGFEEEKIAKIARYIKATELTREPEDYFEKVLRDADCSHFGDQKFFEISESLREEFRNTKDIAFNELDWTKENLKFSTEYHHFYTDFAMKNWQPQKEKNVAELQEKVAELQEEKKKNKKKKKKEKKEEAEKKKLEKSNSPERGVETMFRTTLGNHTKLSQIADSKANILLSVNAIIISIALSRIIPKLDSPSNAHLIIPTFIMLVFSVVCIIFAILSTRPKVSGGSFTRKQIDERKINLLFFGNFYKMPVEEYQWAMKEMMKDKDYLYDSMIKDLYFLGLVLHRKYKLLRITYSIFMIGIIVSVIAFILAIKHFIFF